MPEKRTNILIVGGGKGGEALLNVFQKSATVHIVAIVDVNPTAPALKLAKKLGIPTASNYRKIISEKNIDEIINVAGSEKVQEDLLKIVPQGVGVVSGHTAKLMWDLIEERKRYEEELVLAKEEWERTFNALPDFIAILDNQYRFVRVNKALADKLGVAPEEAAGLICYECIHGLNKPHPLCPNAKLLADGKEHVAELCEERLGGTFLVSTSPLHDERGQLIGSVHIARDITNIRQAEEKARKQSDFLRKVIDSFTQPFYVIDANTYEIKMANAAAYAKGMADVSTCYAFTHKRSKPCSGENPCPLDEIKKTKKPAALEHIHYDKYGNARNVEVYGYPIFDEAGNVVQMIEYSVDVTAQKKMKIELSRKLRDLERFQKVTMGREKRVIELKNELKELKKRLKELKGEKHG